MANRQPGHHTFGLRSATDIKFIDSMRSSLSDVQYCTVYDTTFKQRKYAIGNDSDFFLMPSQAYLNGSGDYFYTGTVVAPFNAGTGNAPAMRLAKASADSERVIGIVAGGTGPTTANPPRLSGIVQYSGKVPVLLQIGQASNIRGRFLELSTGVSGTSNANVSAGLGQYGICTTNAYASGMTGITGLTGNYVTSFIRPIETN